MLLFWGDFHITEADEYTAEFHKHQDNLYYLKSNNEESVLQYLMNSRDNFSNYGLLIPAIEDNSG